MPHFRDGNYEAGILAGVRRVADVIRARQVVAPEQLVPVENAVRVVLVVPPWARTAWILFGTVGAMWLAGVVMAGTMFGQGFSVRSAPNLVFGACAVAIFAALPISFLPRVAFVLVPVALAGGA